MKQFLIVVVMLVAFNALLVFSGALDRLAATQETVAEPTYVPDTVVDVFRFTLEDEVRKKQGQPIEGFEPAMFMAVFPGLVPTDFSGVEASLGHYEVRNGQLELQLVETGLIHSAAGAISRAGYRTLLDNVSARTSIDLQKDGTITEVMSALTTR